MFRSTGLKTGGVMLLGASLFVTGCKRDATAGASGAPPARPPAAVRAVAALTRDVPLYLDEIGKIVSIDSVSIVPQVGGKLLKAHIQDGADVKKGQLLFEIDPRPFEATLAVAKSALTQANAELGLSKSEYTRIEGLKGTAAISQQEIDQKQNAVAISDARRESAEAALQSAQLNLEYTKIYAPIDGRAGARLIVPGNILKANDLPLLLIQRLDPIYAEFTVTENDLGTVRKFLADRGMNEGESPEKGLKVEVDLPGDSPTMLSALGQSAGAPDDSGQASAQKPTSKPTSQPTTQPKRSGARVGELTFLDNAVAAGSGTIRLRATLPNADYYFWPGQFVNCRLILTTKQNAVLIPIEAQQIGQAGPFVFVVKPDQTAEQRPIRPGQRQGNMLVVESGIAAGEQVVTDGQMLVAPGGNLMVIPNGPPPGGPRGPGGGAPATK